MENLVPLHSDFSPVGFQPYVFEVSAAGLSTEADVKCLGFVVMTRNQGLLLAIPMHVLEDDVIAAGDFANPQDLVGPHLDVQVSAHLLVESSPMQDPVPVDGHQIDVLLVDFHSEVAKFLKPVVGPEDLIELLVFDAAEPSMIPQPAELISLAIAWTLEQAGLSQDRMQFYSADEVPETPEATAKVSPSKPKRRTPGGAMPGGDSERAQRKKPTIASVSEAVEKMAAALPGLSLQLQDLVTRTTALEAQSGQVPDRPSVLRQPLGPSATPGLSSNASPSTLIQAMPPPKSFASPVKANSRVHFTQQETQEMAQDFGESPMLAQAVLEQSKALIALVSQIASGDHAMDFGGGSTLTSKGALGRERLRNELAQHKGVFFQAVLQNMSRRMFPGQTAEVDVPTLVSRGALPTMYMERFGRFGKTRDLGFLGWQVALAMNMLAEDNFLGAKDALALLFVCIEQAAMDGGKLDLGLILALVEDPPNSVFTSRSVAASVNPRPFCTQCQPEVGHSSSSILEGDGHDCEPPLRDESRKAAFSNFTPSRDSKTQAKRERRTKGKGPPGNTRGRHVMSRPLLALKIMIACFQVTLDFQGTTTTSKRRLTLTVSLPACLVGFCRLGPNLQRSLPELFTSLEVALALLPQSFLCLCLMLESLRRRGPQCLVL